MKYEVGFTLLATELLCHDTNHQKVVEEHMDKKPLNLTVFRLQVICS